MDTERIRQVAKELDDALETKNIERILPFFADDCEIQLLGIKVKGKEGARRWLRWQFGHVAEYELAPMVIMIEGNVFFEEFMVKARLPDGTELESKQAEVLVYNEDYKVTSLRLYFDRLDFADAVTRDPVSKFVVRRLVKTSLKGLV
jgi:ketosteroid isomerase-like protein